MIFFFGGVGVKYPSSVGRVSGFSGLVFSVSDIVSSPASQWQREVCCADLGMSANEKDPRPIGKNIGVTLMCEDHEHHANTLHTALDRVAELAELRSSHMQCPRAARTRGQTTDDAKPGVDDAAACWRTRST